MYGQQKLLASRIPIVQHTEGSRILQTPKARTRPLASVVDNLDTLSTPTPTDGETATDTDLDTETETECDVDQMECSTVNTNVAILSSPKLSSSSTKSKTRAITQHDLLNRYFRNDTIMLHNLDLLRWVRPSRLSSTDLLNGWRGYYRASDSMLVLVVFYALASLVIPHLSDRATLIMHFAHALLWRLFHTFGLGALLRAQSKSRYLVRHFLKHYHYPDHDSSKGAIQEAFANWKQLYNLSLCMTYSKLSIFSSDVRFWHASKASFFGLAWNTYSSPTEWVVGDQLLRHTMGAVRIQCSLWILDLINLS